METDRGVQRDGAKRSFHRLGENNKNNISKGKREDGHPLFF